VPVAAVVSTVAVAAVVSTAAVAASIVPSQDILSDSPSPRDEMLLDSDSGDEIFVPAVQTPVVIESTPLDTVHEMDVDEDAVLEVEEEVLAERKEEEATPMIIDADSNVIPEETDRAVESVPIISDVVDAESVQPEVNSDSAMETSQSVEKAPVQIIEIEETEIIEYVLEEESFTPMLVGEEIEDISIILPLAPILEEEEDVISMGIKTERSLSINELHLPGPDLYSEIMNEVGKGPEDENTDKDAIVPLVAPAVNKSLNIDEGPVRHSMATERPSASALEDPKYRKRYVL
jgi:hypothetical protein